MSKSFEYADGVTGSEPQGVPNVYLPQSAAPPVYDAYADPAAAHGWQDVYDATVGGAGDPGYGADTPGAYPGATPGRAHPDGTGGAVGAVGADGAGDTRELPSVPPRPRPVAGHRGRRKPAPRLARRVAVAAG
ncbi:hypothetical protein ACWD0Z_39190, partial [Streptomyces sp. NPDC003007]